MGALKKLAGQTAVYGISSIIGRLLNYLLVPFYTRVFTTEQYGIVTEMYAYVAFLIVILTYGMETAFFKFSSGSEDKNRVYNTAVFSIFTTSAIFIFLSTVFSKPIGIFLGYPNHIEYVIWFAIIVGLDAISAIPLAKLRELKKAKFFVVVNLVNITVNIGLNLFFLVYCKSAYESPGGELNWLVQNCYNPEIGVGYVFISNLIASIVKLALLSPYLFRVTFNTNIAMLKAMLIYGLPLLVGGLAGIINETMDRVLLKHLLPLGEKEALEQLGIYGACYKISILMLLFIQAFRFAAEPFFFAEHKKENAKKLFAEVMNYFVIICCFIFLGVMMYIDVVMLFIGEEFREGADVVPILLLANIFLGIFFNLSIWYKLTGKTVYGAYLAIIGALVTLVLNYLWIPTIGYMGAAWATLICYALMMVLSYLQSRKHYAVKYNLGKIFMYIGSAVLFFIISSYFSFDSTLVKYTLNTAFLIMFAIIVFLAERRQNKVPS